MHPRCILCVSYSPRQDNDFSVSNNLKDSERRQDLKMAINTVRFGLVRLLSLLLIKK